MSHRIEGTFGDFETINRNAPFDDGRELELATNINSRIRRVAGPWKATNASEAKDTIRSPVRGVGPNGDVQGREHIKHIAHHLAMRARPPWNPGGQGWHLPDDYKSLSGLDYNPPLPRDPNLLSPRQEYVHSLLRTAPEDVTNTKKFRLSLHHYGRPIVTEFYAGDTEMLRPTTVPNPSPPRELKTSQSPRRVAVGDAGSSPQKGSPRYVTGQPSDRYQRAQDVYDGRAGVPTHSPRALQSQQSPRRRVHVDPLPIPKVDMRGLKASLRDPIAPTQPREGIVDPPAPAMVRQPTVVPAAQGLARMPTQAPVAGQGLARMPTIAPTGGQGLGGMTRHGSQMVGGDGRPRVTGIRGLKAAADAVLVIQHKQPKSTPRAAAVVSPFADLPFAARHYAHRSALEPPAATTDHYEPAPTQPRVAPPVAPLGMVRAVSLLQRENAVNGSPQRGAGLWQQALPPVASKKP